MHAWLCNPWIRWRPRTQFTPRIHRFHPPLNLRKFMIHDVGNGPICFNIKEVLVKYLRASVLLPPLARYYHGSPQRIRPCTLKRTCCHSDTTVNVPPFKAPHPPPAHTRTPPPPPRDLAYALCPTKGTMGENPVYTLGNTGGEGVCLGVAVGQRAEESECFECRM